jgi:hypothetical protein
MMNAPLRRRLFVGQIPQVEGLHDALEQPDGLLTPRLHVMPEGLVALRVAE